MSDLEIKTTSQFNIWNAELGALRSALVSNARHGEAPQIPAQKAKVDHVRCAGSVRALGALSPHHDQ